MSVKTVLFASFAAVLVAGCGENAATSAAPSPASKAAVEISAQSPIDKPFRLTDASPLDVDALLALMPEAFRPTYDSATFDEGLGATVLTGLRFPLSETSGGIAQSDIRVARAELYGVSIDAINQVRDASLAAIDAPMAPILRKVRLFDIAADAGDPTGSGALSIAGLEIDQFSMRQGGTAVDADANKLAVLLNSLELAGLYLKDAKINAAAQDARVGSGAAGEAPNEVPNEVEGGSVRLAAADIRLVSVGGGRLGAFLAKDFETDLSQSAGAMADALQELGPQMAFLLNGPFRNFILPARQTNRYESFEWRDMDFSRLLVYGLRNELPPLDERDVISMGDMRTINTETLINGKRASLVSETAIADIEFTWLIPSKMRAFTKGGTYDLTAYVDESETDVVTALTEAGLNTLTADSTVQYDWNAKNGDMRVVGDMTAPALADGRFNFALGGLKLAEIAAAVEAENDAAIAEAVAFENFSLTIDDKTLLDTFYALAALQSGTEPDLLREQAPALLQFASLQFRQLNPRYGDFVNALGAFLEDGGQLTIAAEPGKPVTLAEIDAVASGDPQKVAEILNLTMTHKK